MRGNKEQQGSGQRLKSMPFHPTQLHSIAAGIQHLGQVFPISSCLSLSNLTSSVDQQRAGIPY